MRRHPNDPEVSGPAVLAVLRGRSDMRFRDLCERLKVRGATMKGALIETLAMLHKNGLIIADRPDFSGWECDATIKIDPSVRDLAQLLGLSIKELARRDRNTSIVCSPLFGRPTDLPESDAAEIFVLMPFSEDFPPIYDDHIKPVARRLGVTVKRGDDLMDPLIFCERNAL